jgi:ArsR family transcriptional regulator, arsenate/arsenite/antimonite-responsive transcriptional repressor / arsenate reductase (thioredoxin)
VDRRPSRDQRAARHAALGDPIRLSIVDELVGSDRTPFELGRLTGVGSNLLAHHLDVLEGVGLITRSRSSGDARRRYVHLRRETLTTMSTGSRIAAQPVLFLCTHNSARSQLAAVLWSRLTAQSADSAGTHPAARVHPGAVAAARRAGMDLGDRRPRLLDETIIRDRLVVTVCDRAHEELEPGPSWLHWSVADPVAAPSKAAFDATVADLSERIMSLVEVSSP